MKKEKPTICNLILLMLLLFISCGDENVLYDERDEQEYSIKKMADGNIWMAENLNYKTENSICLYEDDEKCIEFGRLYNWTDVKKACPKGWHLPSDDEWHELVKPYGGAGGSFWSNLPPQEEAEDKKKSFWELTSNKEVGFNVKLGGSGGIYTKGLKFSDENKITRFWTSTKTPHGEVVFYTFRTSVYRETYDEPNNVYYYCRCTKDK